MCWGSSRRILHLRRGEASCVDGRLIDDITVLPFFATWLGLRRKTLRASNGARERHEAPLAFSTRP